MRVRTQGKSIVAIAAATAFALATAAGAGDTPADETLEEISLGEYYELGPDEIDDEELERIRQSVRRFEESRPPSAEDELKRYFSLYRDALDNESYLEAETLAKRVVELAIEVYSIDSVDAAKALTNLGIAQHHNEDYESAELNYRAAIEIIERVEDRLNTNLINPLKGLGAAQLASGRPDLASQTFQRAVHISHVNEGPHNLMQVDILESLAESYIAIGEFDAVEDLQSRVFGLEARDVRLDSLEIVPAMERQARWQHRLQLFEKERYTWRKIIDIIEDHRGKDDLSLISPLTELGKSYLYVGAASMAFHQPTSINSGEIYLKRALRIAEENPEADWQTREGAMLALGDFYILSGKPGRAKNIYKDTWNLLSGDEQKLAKRHDHLENLVVLRDVNPPKYVGIDGEVRESLPGDDYESGTIVYDYSVSTRGFTTDIELAEAQPDGFDDMERAVLNELRGMIHRPRLEEGVPVETNDLTYKHRFFYRQSDLEEVQKEADLAATN